MLRQVHHALQFEHDSPRPSQSALRFNHWELRKVNNSKLQNLISFKAILACNRSDFDKIQKHPPESAGNYECELKERYYIRIDHDKLSIANNVLQYRDKENLKRKLNS